MEQIARYRRKGGIYLTDNILVMTNITKTYPGVRALDNVNLEVERGEIHAVVGENGAGKSTLMKILTGVFQKDEGSICYKGKEVHIPNTKAAQEIGIGIIHQELNLMPDLTVAQNIFPEVYADDNELE